MKNKYLFLLIGSLIIILFISQCINNKYYNDLIDAKIKIEVNKVVNTKLDSIFNSSDTVVTDLIDLATFMIDNKLFLDKMGYRESRNQYDIVNTLGYMGKYQFGSFALKQLGITISKDDYLHLPYIQEKSMMLLMRYNQKFLKSEIENFNGKEWKGVKISESGILAAAHLAGADNVKLFFKSGINSADKYGTSMKNYINYFYNIKLKL